MRRVAAVALVAMVALAPGWSSALAREGWLRGEHLMLEQWAEHAFYVALGITWHHGHVNDPASEMRSLDAPLAGVQVARPTVSIPSAIAVQGEPTGLTGAFAVSIWPLGPLSQRPTSAAHSFADWVSPLPDLPPRRDASFRR